MRHLGKPSNQSSKRTASPPLNSSVSSSGGILRKNTKIATGVLILVGIIFGLLEGLKYFLALLSAASPEVAASVVGGMSTALVGIAAAFLAHRSARIRASDDAHRVKKVEIYRAFLEIVARLMANENKNVNLKHLKEDELIQFLVKFKSDIMLWGSPRVLNSMREFTVQAETKGPGMFKAMDDLYRAIRNDIGLSNKGLEEYALVKMYLSDPSELDAMVTANNAFKPDAGKSGAA